MQDPKQLMMRGTGGKSDYQVFARRGDVALGFKFYGFANAPDGNSRIFFKLRAAAASSMKEPPEKGQVVSLADAKVGYKDAWTKFAWMKVGEGRSSTDVSMVEEGSPGNGPEALAKRLRDGSTADKFVDFFLQGLNSQDELVLRRKQVRDVIVGIFAPAADMLDKAAVAVKEGGPGNPKVGVVGTHAASIQKLFSEDDLSGIEGGGGEEQGDD